MTLDEYILHHIDDEGDYLKALYRDTHLKLLYPRMASGHLQGRMLKMFVRMIRPRQILEIGTYSGYSALCMAEGLPDDGMLHTFEINDEQEDFTRPWLENSPYAGKIKFYIGDAWSLCPGWESLSTLLLSTAISAVTSIIMKWCWRVFRKELYHSRQYLVGRTRTRRTTAPHRLADYRYKSFQ